MPGASRRWPRGGRRRGPSRSRGPHAERSGRGPTASISRGSRVPLGVIGIIYESRPNVTADAGGALPARRQCRDPARRLGKPAFLGGDPRLPARRARRGGPAGGCDPAPAHHRPRGGRRAAAPGRLRRRDRAPGRARADRAGAAREPHSRPRPSRRALPHLYRRRRRSRHGAADRAQRQDAAHRRLRRDRDPADRSPHRRGPAARHRRRSSGARCELRGDDAARAHRSAHRHRERGRLGHRISRRHPLHRGRRRRGGRASRISPAMARAIPRRS